MLRSLGIFAIVLAAHGIVVVGGARHTPATAAGPLDIEPTKKLMATRDARDTATKTFNLHPEVLAWQWFLMLNEPLGDSGVKLWEGWKQTSFVYLPDGKMPLPWNQNPPLPNSVTRQAEAQHLDMSKPFHNLDAEIQVDGLVLRDVFRQNVRYQLLMNEDTFNYILENGIYNVNGQEKLAVNQTPADFPWQSWELKTSWIWIGNDQKIPDKVKQELEKTYYMVNAYYQYPKKSGEWHVGRAALTGMHIINKLLPEWVWVTFENVNNSKYTVTNNQPPVPMTNQLPISEAAKAANARFRKALKEEESIFQHYQLIGVQYRFVDEGGKATLLANSQIESAFQHTSSCITCHGLASYSLPDGYFNLVKSKDGGIAYYTGDPPEHRLQGYTSLDFVWSLKRADRKR